jgi:hypothetical protein
VTLRFPYQQIPLQGPPPPTLPATARQRSRPLIPVRLTSLSTGLFRDFPSALLDSGADDTIFPLGAAQALGIAFLPAVAGGHSIRWGGASHAVRYGEVRLELSDGTERWTWQATVAFLLAPIRYPLLGQCGCLEYCDVTLRGAAQVVELEANPSFPGGIT